MSIRQWDPVERRLVVRASSESYMSAPIHIPRKTAAEVRAFLADKPVNVECPKCHKQFDYPTVAAVPGACPACG